MRLFLPLAAAIVASGCDRAPPQAPTASTASFGPAASSAASAPGASPGGVDGPAAPSPPISAAPTEPPRPADLPPRLRALGTEPFWAVRIEADRITYTTPDDQQGQTIKIRREATPHGAVLIGRLDDANFVLAIARRQCSDGMSDRVYRWRAVLKHDGRTLEGCAETPDRLSTAPAP